MGSDHKSVLISIEGSSRPPKRDDLPPRHFCTRRACWNTFGTVISDGVASLPLSENLKESVPAFTALIIRAASAAIPLQRPSGKRRSSCPWWSPDCRLAVNYRNKALRIFRASPSPLNLSLYRRASAFLKKTVKSAKRKCWRAYCSTLTHRSSPVDVWRCIGRIQGSIKPRSSQVGPLRGPDGLAYDASIMADLLCRSYISRSLNLDPQELVFNPCGPKTVHLGSESVSAPFTMTELDLALRGLRDSSPGPDLVPATCLQHLPQVAKTYLLALFNSSWLSGVVPREWKESIIVPILKPGKPADDVKSYRPISLTSTIAKTIERMINSRLVYYMDLNRLWSSSQSGGRKGRSTADNVNLFTNQVKTAFAAGEYLAGAFLDFSQAFDSLYPREVVQSLYDEGIPVHCAIWIFHFLIYRSVRVRCMCAVSAEYYSSMGVPQGAVLSPTLFNLVVNSLARVTHLSDILQFLDDLLIWFRHRNVTFLVGKLQSRLNEVLAWATARRLEFNPLKSVVILFSLRRQVPIVLKLGESAIPCRPSSKFLGVVFDQKLQWHFHVQDVYRRAVSRIAILKMTSRRSWGADCSTLRMLYCALIRSVLDYCCFLFIDASKRTLAPLERLQHSALCIVTGLRRTTSYDAAQVEAGLLPLALRRDALAMRYLSSRLGASESIFVPLRGLEINAFYRKWPRGRPLDISRFPALLADNGPRSFSSPSFPVPWPQTPWRSDQYFEVIETRGVFSGLPGPLSADVAFNLMIEELGLRPWTHLYTDGAKTEGYVRCGFLCPELNTSVAVELDPHLSIFLAEVGALIIAIDFISELPPGQFLILTDSLSALQALDGTNWCALLDWNSPINELHFMLRLLRRSGRRVAFGWVPSHSGIVGNEKVDSLLKSPGSKGRSLSFPLTCRELKTKSDSQILSRWQMAWNDSPKGRFVFNIVPQVGRAVGFPHLPRLRETVLTRARHNQLPFRQLLYRWGRVTSPNCPDCSIPETMRHVLFECPNFTARRAVLEAICAQLTLPFTLGSLLNRSSSFTPLLSSLRGELSSLLLEALQQIPG